MSTKYLYSLNITLFYLVFSGIVSAASITTIKCASDNYSIEIQVDDQKSLPPKSSFKVFKGDSQVKQGSFDKIFEGYEGSFLNAYVWEFIDSEKNSIGIASTEIKELTAGEWNGNSDLFIEINSDVFQGNTIECKIIIR